MTAGPRIVLLVRSLGRGGAERQVVHLAHGLHQRGWHVTVIAFYGGGALDGEVSAGGVPLVVLGKRGRWDVVSFVLRLRRELRRARPDVVHSVLDVPNVIAALAVGLRRRPPLVWGVRGSQRDRGHYDRLHAVTLGLERTLAARAQLVIVNSEAGAENIRGRRWRVAPGALLVVPNGIEAPVAGGSDARARVRADWGVDASSFVFAIVGRLDPVKGHRLFLDAAARVVDHLPDARFVIVGDGPASERDALRQKLDELSLASRVVWAGHRADMAGVYAAVDVLVSASTSEGFSNAVAEAMATGVVPVVTDVGDSARLVGTTGLVVPPGDTAALAGAMCDVAGWSEEQRTARGRQARDRVVGEYGVDVMVRRTEQALAALVRGARS